MKRKAILIEASDVAGCDDLPGARVDMENWKNFLKSDLGGAWEDTEIVHLKKPNSGDVDAYLTAAKDGYCFVAYSGHGCDGGVVLNEHWKNAQYPIASLKPKGDKGTLIVDSCRGVKAVLISFSGQMAFANEAGHAVALNARQGRSVVFASSTEIYEHQIRKQAGLIIKPRQVFDKSVEDSAKGIVEMLSCSKGQAAEEDPKAGGYYTSLLLQSADLWKASSTYAKVHTTKDAHDYAASKLSAQQTPEYKPTALTFPFSVKE